MSHKHGTPHAKRTAAPRIHFCSMTSSTLANMTSDDAYDVHRQRTRQHACLRMPLCWTVRTNGDDTMRLADVLIDIRDTQVLVVGDCSLRSAHTTALHVSTSDQKWHAVRALFEVRSVCSRFEDVGLQTMGPPHRDHAQRRTRRPSRASCTLVIAQLRRRSIRRSHGKSTKARRINGRALWLRRCFSLQALRCGFWRKLNPLNTTDKNSNNARFR